MVANVFFSLSMRCALGYLQSVTEPSQQLCKFKQLNICFINMETLNIS